MRRRRLWLWLAPLALAGFWIYRVKSQPPAVPLATVRRETLLSTLESNGKAEPIRWEAVRAETAGLVQQVPVQEGQPVAPGAVLATLAASGLAAELRQAEARLEQVRAERSTVQAGGRAAELAEIQSSLRRARFDRDRAQREVTALERLVAKQAATEQELTAARNTLREAELQIQALESKRASLVDASDREVAEARVRDAQAAVAAVRERMARNSVRAPIGGVIYHLATRPGAYVNPGDLIADVGRLERLRVRVYVDEPELGRVREGQPVTITWDALPGREWKGTVEKKPLTVTTVGTRQVGEVLTTVENPGRDLLPGTNVNAEIRTNVVPDALTIPKEALRRDASGAGVLALRGDRLVWQPVKTGASAITRVQVLSGLSEGDRVVLPTERALAPGQKVQAASGDAR